MSRIFLHKAINDVEVVGLTDLSKLKKVFLVESSIDFEVYSVPAHSVNIENVLNLFT